MFSASLQEAVSISLTSTKWSSQRASRGNFDAQRNQRRQKRLPDALQCPDELLTRRNRRHKIVAVLVFKRNNRAGAGELRFERNERRLPVAGLDLLQNVRHR